MYLIATDHIPADGKTDVSDSLQKLIDENPNRFTDDDFVLGENGSIQKVTLGETLLYK